MLALQCLLTPAAMASTSYSYYNTNIILNDSTISSPKHIVAVDPSSGVQTSFVPVWYVDYALGKLNIQANWDGVNGRLNLSVPSSFTIDLSNLPSAKSVNSLNMSIAINGTVVGYAPRAKASLGYNNQNTGVFVPFQLQYVSSNDPFTWAKTNDLFQETSVTGPSSTLMNSDESQIIHNLEWWMNGYKEVNGTYYMHDILESHYAEYFGIVTQYCETESQYQQSTTDAQNYMERVTFTGTAKGGTIKVTLPNSKSSSTITCYQVADGDYWYGWFGNDTGSQSQGGTTLSVPNNGGTFNVNVISGKYNLIGTSVTIPNSSSGLQLSQAYDGGIPTS